MALRKSETKAPAKSNDMVKADGWLNNPHILDKHGNPHRLPKGMPLYVDNNVMASVINAEKARMAAYQESGCTDEYEPLTVTVTFSVYVPSDKAPEPVEF